MLSSSQKLRYTSITSLALQLVTLICGFVLPRMYLSYYGSAVNGLVASITQFLSFIALAECGVGAVVRSAFYRPLATKDNKELSLIVVSSESFFRKIALLLFIYVIVLFFVYPFFVKESFDFVYSASLVVIISISFFAQYYFGMTSKLLLSSNQYGFVFLSIQIVALIINLIISVILMRFGASIHFVRLTASLIFVVQPIAIYIYVKRKYSIDRTLKPKKDAIPQKWNGFAQHLAAIVLVSSGVVILSVGAPISLVSVFSIYSFVVMGVKNLVDATTSGVQAFFGDLFAQNKIEELKKAFIKFQWQMHTLVTIVFSLTAVLITSFVSVYTKNIIDVNYIVPVFGVLFSAAWGMYCYRLIYNVIILSVGHYRQTQNSAFIEAVLNVFFSVIFYVFWGLEGIALGIFIAMLYRTIYLARYVTKEIFKENYFFWVKFFLVDFVVIVLFCGFRDLFDKFFVKNVLDNFFDWCLLALKNGALIVFLSYLLNFVVFKKSIFHFLKS